MGISLDLTESTLESVTERATPIALGLGQRDVYKKSFAAALPEEVEFTINSQSPPPLSHGIAAISHLYTI